MNPYTKLADKHFWATAVARRNMFEISGLWEPKARIKPGDKIVTFGSCFAQHLGNALKSNGFNWHITEKAPPALGVDDARKFNYGVFTARTGNIYTVSLLRQWTSWALGDAQPPEEVWEKGGRFYDPFRPNVEPDGFESVEELRLSRQMAIEAFRRALEESDLFVFTLGLTESWFNVRDGYEYPMCPGTVAGTFDPDAHRFVNQDYATILSTLTEVLRRIRSVNRSVRILLTVSPVPLTATMSGAHVLVATMESKSILRAVAGRLTKQFAFVDYFPSYEIINATAFRGTFFEPNQRSVSGAGVNHVMKLFFECHDAKFPPQAHRQPRPKPQARAADVVCEEQLLDAFGG